MKKLLALLLLSLPMLGQQTPPPFLLFANSANPAAVTSILTTGQTQTTPPAFLAKCMNGTLVVDCSFTGGSSGTIAHTTLVLKGDNVGNAVAATGVDEAITAALGASGNIFLGDVAAPNIGNNNVVLGHNAGKSLTFTPNTATTSAYENVLIGNGAGQNLTTGNFSILIGSLAGGALTGTGVPVEDTIVTAIGAGAYQALTTGGNDIAVGEDAGSGVVNSSSDTILGVHAMTPLNGIISNNVIIGQDAMVTDGGSGYTITNDVIIGELAAALLAKGNSNNVVIGHDAANNFTTGTEDVYIGESVVPLASTAVQNVVIGRLAAGNITTGTQNTIIGYEAGNAQSTASNNISIGAFGGSDTGSNNIELGGFTGGGGGSTASGQVVIGVQSCNGMTGSNNTCVGSEAKNPDTGGTGHDNLLLGNTAQTTTNINGAIQLGAGKNISGNSLQAFTIPILGTTTFTATGCTNSTLVGGATAGSYHSGTTGTCTVVITTGLTAPNGWACFGNDLTTTADTIKQTATSATTATLAGTTVTGDVINFGCQAY